MIPVKMETSSQEFYLRRCLASIRRLYPTTKVIIALAKGTYTLSIDDPNTIQVENPYFSTLGCIYLFYKNRYAESAYILHDSMVVTKPIPKSNRDVSFLFCFHEPGMNAIQYNESYGKLLPIEQHFHMVQTSVAGCFGVAMKLNHSVIERLNILPVIPKVTTKTDFCAMERVFPYLCKRANVRVEALCGNIYGGDSDPWQHPELITMTLEEIIAKNYSACIVKSLVGRI